MECVERQDVAVGPKTLDELMALVPGVRTMRSMNADTLRHLLNRQRRECTWCGQPVGKGRSTWCSDQCVEAFRSRCDSGRQVTLVNARDRGICQVCGRDTRQAKMDALEAWKSQRKQVSWGTGEYHKREREVYERYGWARGGWFEIDHIVPVVEGGGLIGIENLRTLCGACHAEETRKLAKRRSQNGK